MEKDMFNVNLLKHKHNTAEKSQIKRYTHHIEKDAVY